MRHGILACVAGTIIVFACNPFAWGQQSPPRPPGRLPPGVTGIVTTPRTAPPVVRRASPGGPSQCNAASSSVEVRAFSRSSPGLILPFRYIPFYAPANYNYMPRYPYPRRAYEPQTSPGETAKHFLLPQPSSDEEKAKARELVARGDASFARRQYAAAIAKYKQAARAAPDVADARIRQVLALVAQRKYPAAVKLFFETLDADANLSAADLNLASGYDSEQMAQTTDALVRLVDAKPMNANLALALGIQLLISGQGDRAEKYFARAVQLGADPDDRLAGFLQRAVTF